jgi:hypothetical protein
MGAGMAGRDTAPAAAEAEDTAADAHGLAPTEFEEEDEEETEEEAEDEEENTEEEEAEEEEEEEDDLPRAPTLVSAANSFACGACLLALDPGV